MRTVEAVRRFNRFYTQLVGGLEESYLGSRWSLAEARVLFEIGATPDGRAKDIGERLNCDAGYLSRILRGFSKHGLVERRVDRSDQRVWRLRLTAAGRAELQRLNAAADQQMADLLAKLSRAEQRKLVEAMQFIENQFSREKQA